jgi:hypothetical protein
MGDRESVTPDAFRGNAEVLGRAVIFQELGKGLAGRFCRPDNKSRKFPSKNVKCKI